MKVALSSDLHLEFADLEIKNTDGADVLVLAGDIMIAEELYDFPAPNDEPSWDPSSTRSSRAGRYRDFLSRCSSEFPHTLFVAGNHEFYNGKWMRTLDVLRSECEKFPNIHFLENDTFVLDDVTFIGGTLWTDMNRSDPLTIYHVRDAMNDYRAIRVEHEDYRRLKPADTIARHYRMLDYIRQVTAERSEDKFFVIGHMAPSKQSTHPHYADDILMNGAYSSNLDNFILERPQIRVWVHGHTHHRFDYLVGQTRIVANPRGYVGWERGSQQDDPYYPQIIEI